MRIISDRENSVTHNDSRVSKMSDVVFVESSGSVKQRKENVAAVQALEAELKRQEEHYLKLIEQQTAIYSSKEKSFQTEILNLQQ